MAPFPQCTPHGHDLVRRWTPAAPPASHLLSAALCVRLVGVGCSEVDGRRHRRHGRVGGRLLGGHSLRPRRSDAPRPRPWAAAGRCKPAWSCEAAAEAAVPAQQRGGWCLAAWARHPRLRKLWRRRVARLLQPPPPWAICHLNLNKFREWRGRQRHFSRFACTSACTPCAYIGCLYLRALVPEREKTHLPRARPAGSGYQIILESIISSSSGRLADYFLYSYIASWGHTCPRR